MVSRRHRAKLQIRTGGTATATRCPLGQCAPGSLVVVVQLDCAPADARRLRPLGVFEGAYVRVVGGHHGTILDVRGARLALDSDLARTIIVEPVSL